MNPYQYDDSPVNADLRLKKRKSGYLLYEVRFASPIDTGHEENKYIIGDYCQPVTEGKAPLVILVHGVGDHSVIPCRVIAGNMLKQGIACCILYLPIHSRRLPGAMRKHMPYLNTDEWYQVYRISVIDIQRIVDWAYTRDELDIKNIAVLGISFGGFVSAISMAVDVRIKAGIFIVAGGNANKISWLSRSGHYRKRYPRSLEEHEEVMRQYRDYLKEVEGKGFENVTPYHLSFLNDPLTFAGKLTGRPVLMINAVKDRYIPVECVEEFWNASGKPEIEWIPAGHTTLWFRYRTVRRTVNDFLRRFIMGESQP